MADWATVRYDPSYEEKLDVEIVPLCYAAGIVTTSSCCGHGQNRTSGSSTAPTNRSKVWRGSSWPPKTRLTACSREIRLDEYAWSIEIHLNDVYADTPPREAVVAMNNTAARVDEWRKLVVVEP